MSRLGSTSRKRSTLLQTLLDSTQEIIAFIGRSLKPFDLLAKPMPSVKENDISPNFSYCETSKQSRSKVCLEPKSSANIATKDSVAQTRSYGKDVKKSGRREGWLGASSLHPGCDPLCDQDYQMFVWPTCESVCPIRCEKSTMGSKYWLCQNQRTVGNISPKVYSEFSRSHAAARSITASPDHPSPSGLSPRYKKNLGKQQGLSESDSNQPSVEALVKTDLQPTAQPYPRSATASPNHPSTSRLSPRYKKNLGKQQGLSESDSNQPSVEALVKTDLQPTAQPYPRSATASPNHPSTSRLSPRYKKNLGKQQGLSESDSNQPSVEALVKTDLQPTAQPYPRSENNKAPSRSTGHRLGEQQSCPVQHVTGQKLCLSERKETLWERRSFEEEAEKMIRDRKLTRVINKSPPFPLWYKTLDEMNDVCPKSYQDFLRYYSSPNACPRTYSSPAKHTPSNRCTVKRQESSSNPSSSLEKDKVQDGGGASFPSPKQKLTASQQIQPPSSPPRENEEKTIEEITDLVQSEGEQEEKSAELTTEPEQEREMQPPPVRRYFQKETDDMIRNKKRAAFVKKLSSGKSTDLQNNYFEDGVSGLLGQGSACFSRTDFCTVSDESKITSDTCVFSQEDAIILSPNSHRLPTPNILGRSSKTCLRQSLSLSPDKAGANSSHRSMPWTDLEEAKRDICFDEKCVVIDQRASIGVFIKCIGETNSYKVCEKIPNKESWLSEKQANPLRDVEITDVLNFVSSNSLQPQDVRAPHRGDLLVHECQSQSQAQKIEDETDQCNSQTKQLLKTAVGSSKPQETTTALGKMKTSQSGLQWHHDVSQNQSYSSERVADQDFAGDHTPRVSSQDQNHRSAGKMSIYLTQKSSGRSLEGELRSARLGKEWSRSYSADDRKKRHKIHHPQKYDKESMNRNAASSAPKSRTITPAGARVGRPLKPSKSSTQTKSTTGSKNIGPVKNSSNEQSQTDKSKLSDGQRGSGASTALKSESGVEDEPTQSTVISKSMKDAQSRSESGQEQPPETEFQSQKLVSEQATEGLDFKGVETPIESQAKDLSTEYRDAQSFPHATPDGTHENTKPGQPSRVHSAAEDVSKNDEFKDVQISARSQFDEPKNPDLKKTPNRVQSDPELAQDKRRSKGGQRQLKSREKDSPDTGQKTKQALDRTPQSNSAPPEKKNRKSPADTPQAENSYKADILEFDSEDQRSPNYVIPLKAGAKPEGKFDYDCGMRKSASDEQLSPGPTDSKQAGEANNTSKGRSRLESTPKSVTYTDQRKDPCSALDEKVSDPERSKRDKNKKQRYGQRSKDQARASQESSKCSSSRSTEGHESLSKKTCAFQPRYYATCEYLKPDFDCKPHTSVSLTRADCRPQRVRDTSSTRLRECSPANLKRKNQKGSCDRLYQKDDTLQADVRAASKDHTFTSERDSRQSEQKGNTPERSSSSDHMSQKYFWMSKRSLPPDTTECPPGLNADPAIGRERIGIEDKYRRSEKSKPIRSTAKCRATSSNLERPWFPEKKFSKTNIKSDRTERSSSKLHKLGKSSDWKSTSRQASQTGRFGFSSPDCCKPNTVERDCYFESDRARGGKSESARSRRFCISDDSWLDSPITRNPTFSSTRSPRLTRTREFYESNPALYLSAEEATCSPRRTARQGERNPPARSCQEPSPPCREPMPDESGECLDEEYQPDMFSGCQSGRGARDNLLGTPGYHRSSHQNKRPKRRPRGMIPRCFSSPEKYHRSKANPGAYVDQFRYDTSGYIGAGRRDHSGAPGYDECRQNSVVRKVSFLGLQEGHYIHVSVTIGTARRKWIRYIITFITDLS